jgi:hypothetical protein
MTRLIQLYQDLDYCIEHSKVKKAGDIVDHILKQASRYGPATFKRHIEKVKEIVQGR